MGGGTSCGMRPTESSSFGDISYGAERGFDVFFRVAVARGKSHGTLREGTQVLMSSGGALQSRSSQHLVVYLHALGNLVGGDPVDRE